MNFKEFSPLSPKANILAGGKFSVTSLFLLVPARWHRPIRNTFSVDFNAGQCSFKNRLLGYLLHPIQLKHNNLNYVIDKCSPKTARFENYRIYLRISCYMNTYNEAKYGSRTNQLNFESTVRLCYNELSGTTQKLSI
jgi:hypothetical protein